MSTLTGGESVLLTIIMFRRNTMKVGEMELKFLHTPGHIRNVYFGEISYLAETPFSTVHRKNSFQVSSLQQFRLNKKQVYTLPDDTIVLLDMTGYDRLKKEQSFCIKYICPKGKINMSLKS